MIRLWYWNQCCFMLLRQTVYCINTSIIYSLQISQYVTLSLLCFSQIMLMLFYVSDQRYVVVHYHKSSRYDVSLLFYVI